MYNTNESIILASGSPRRKEYLLMMGLDFTVETTSIDEVKWRSETPAEFVGRMAFEKGVRISENNPDSWVISADTIVCLKDRVFGKPSSVEEAVTTLVSLSGKRHLVKSGFCVRHLKQGIIVEKVVTTEVLFWGFPHVIAKAYATTGESMDKAGAYGIQGKGAQLVREIRGSYSNVVGLPLSELVEQLLHYRVIQAV
jgi:septum formation protein